MSTAVKRTIQTIEQVVKVLPVGTNLALVRLMWAMVNGSFLQSRGAVHSALAASGFANHEIRRSWRALWRGVWSIDELTIRWRQQVEKEALWQPRIYEGYRVLSVDITSFWRPKLQHWYGRFYHRLANRLMPGVGFGIVAQIGSIDRKRIPLLKRIIRTTKNDDDEENLQTTILKQVPTFQEEDEIFVHDAGITILQVQEAKIPRYVIRIPNNCTARRNELPAPKKRGRPAEYGEIVRPLARSYRGREIPATQADESTQFEFAGRTIEAKGWFDVVRSDQKVAAQNETFDIWVFRDPLFDKPLAVGLKVKVSAESSFRIYLDRWPVEQPPLVAKQMLGLHRQFVFAPVSCQRLPELALLTGNILTYLAATLPPIPSGYWDRRPKKHLVGCDVIWQRVIFQKITLLLL